MFNESACSWESLHLLTFSSSDGKHLCDWILKGQNPRKPVFGFPPPRTPTSIRQPGNGLSTRRHTHALGRLVTKDDKDGPAVIRNLARARAKWASMRRFLVRDAVDPKTMATFYRTVVLYVLLYGSESWVLTGDLMRLLRSFHRRCCRGLTGEFIRQDEEGEWICPKSEEVLKRRERSRLRNTFRGGGIQS
jgi:hypothetical protein